ncbi:hypothetical protein DSO57_1016598 [Entomophthora muscae]|uniref:Uncharacterized protein n=1 Tax=Entomophthora muscae TaxID=34485 RepID=A0ACC2SHR2_9FUNG|nr:hypothetical protein DSO57_1016598 [Entomophthora muscae]
MILPVLKFVVFSLAPFLLLLWSASPDLWSHLSSSARLVRGNPVNLLHFPGELFISGEAVVKSSTCNDLDLHADDYAMLAPVLEEMLELTPPNLDRNNLIPLQAPVKLPSALTCTPWLLVRLALIGLNAYFPQLSHVSSLWSPLQAAIPVLHWAASWWFVSPGWEPNLVSLAPLSHTYGPVRGIGLKFVLKVSIGKLQYWCCCESLLQHFEGSISDRGPMEALFGVEELSERCN